MKNEILLEDASNTVPLLLIKQIAKSKGWQVTNQSKEELSIDINTCFGDIGLFFMWSESYNLLQISAILDVHIDTYVYPDVYELLSLINEKMLLGHFSIISGANLPLYRNSVMLSGHHHIIDQQINDLIDIAISESNKYFTAFTEIKKGIGAKTALVMAIPECLGNA